MSERRISNVLIVGAGWVGRQIAAKLAQQGIDVLLVDQAPNVVADAQRWFESLESLDSAEPRDIQAVNEGDWQSRISPRESLPSWTTEQAVDAKIDLIIECVSEQLSVKRRILKLASELFPPPTRIVSNSSYFVPSLFEPHITAPQRYGHLHFHVPVLRDSIVDIVGCEKADPKLVKELEQFATSIGLQAIVLRREHPGYVFNWMLQAVLQSALELVALDVVDVEDVDRSWKSVTGMPLGPFEIMDQIGLDVVEQVLANARWAPPIDVKAEQLLALLSEKTKSGQLGRKTLQGFYPYEDDTQLH